MKKLSEACRNYVTARTEYEEAARHIVRNSQVMDDKSLFWKMVGDLRNKIAENIRRDDCVRFGCTEFLRKTISEGGDGYSSENLPDFIRTYGKLKSTLFNKLINVVNYDANFEDLVDALPLAGQYACLKVILETPADRDGLVMTIIVGCEPYSALVELIVTKENRVEQKLEDAYCDMLCDIMTSNDEEPNENYTI